MGDDERHRSYLMAHLRWRFLMMWWLWVPPEWIAGDEYGRRQLRKTRLCSFIVLALFLIFFAVVRNSRVQRAKKRCREPFVDRGAAGL
jgi:hypothetical protein